MRLSVKVYRMVDNEQDPKSVTAKCSVLRLHQPPIHLVFQHKENTNRTSVVTCKLKIHQCICLPLDTLRRACFFYLDQPCGSEVYINSARSQLKDYTEWGIRGQGEKSMFEHFTPEQWQLQWEASEGSYPCPSTIMTIIKLVVNGT